MSTYNLLKKIDDLGRIAIPKEVRRQYRIREGDCFEIVLREDGILLKKYSPLRADERVLDSVFYALSGKGYKFAIYDRDSLLRQSYLPPNCLVQFPKVPSERWEINPYTAKQDEEFAVLPVTKGSHVVGYLVLFGKEADYENDGYVTACFSMLGSSFSEK